MTFLANGGLGLTARRKSTTPGKPVKIHWESHKSVAENASSKLPELARGFFEAGYEVAAADNSFKALHRFRLLTKRFRYTLELFTPCYGPGLTQRIKSLRTLQQYLGDINDCAATEALLLERKDLRVGERDRLVQRLEELAVIRTAKFHRYWQQDFGRPGRERWWIDYLSRFSSLRRK
jgi:CHAD domain-containing protein